LLKQPRCQECSLLIYYPDISCPSLSNVLQMRNSHPMLSNPHLPHIGLKRNQAEKSSPGPINRHGKITF